MVNELNPNLSADRFALLQPNELQAAELATEEAIADASELDFDPATCDNPDFADQVAIETEVLQGRARRISATIQIPYPAQQVWAVLTNYEALSEFIPNLALSRPLDSPDGNILIEQVGTQKLLNINFSARVVLAMQEEFPTAVRFQMVEGDFKSFVGAWLLAPTDDGAGTALTYTVDILPKLTMPIKLVECRLRMDLPVNLVAIRQQVVKLATTAA